MAYKSAQLPFDPFKDFAPVSVIGSIPLFIAVQPSLMMSSVPELVEYERYATAVRRSGARAEQAPPPDRRDGKPGPRDDKPTGATVSRPARSKPDRRGGCRSATKAHPRDRARAAEADGLSG
jgi:hypothetical protein